MKCVKCGMDISENANFCEFCGNKVETLSSNSNPISSIETDNIESISDIKTSVGIDKIDVGSTIPVGSIPDIFLTDANATDNNIKITNVDINEPAVSKIESNEEPVMINPIDSGLKIEDSFKQDETINNEIPTTNLTAIPDIFNNNPETLNEEPIKEVSHTDLESDIEIKEPVLMTMPVLDNLVQEEKHELKEVNNYNLNENVASATSLVDIVKTEQKSQSVDFKPLELEEVKVSDIKEPTLNNEMDLSSDISVNPVMENIEVKESSDISSSEIKPIDESPVDVTPALVVNGEVPLESLVNKEEVKEEPLKEEQKKSNLGTIIIVIIVILAALIGAAYYYLFNNKTISSLDVLSNSLSKMSEITSMKATGNLKYTYINNVNCNSLEQTNCVNQNTNIDLNFDMLVLYAKNANDNNILNVNVKNTQTNEQMALYFVTDKDNNEVSYISSKFIDMLGFTSSPSNIWLVSRSVDTNDLNSSGESMLNIKDIKIDSINAKEIFTDEDVKLIDNIGGIDHYRIIIDENKYNKIMESTNQNADIKLDTFDGVIELDIYIDSNTKYITKLIMTSTSNPTNNLNLTIDFSDINDTVVTLPEEVKNTTKTVESYITENAVIK